MRLVLTRSPNRITDQILKALQTCSLYRPPSFIRITLAPGAKHNQCILNVREYCNRTGAQPLLGWKINVWPRILVQIVGHAVVRESGVLRCITPGPDDEDQILFVEDENLLFDFSDPRARMPSRMIASASHPDIKEFISNESEMIDIRCQGPRTSGLIEITGPSAERLMQLQTDQIELIRRISLRSTKLNDRCICESGRRFSRCCRNSMVAVGPY